MRFPNILISVFILLSGISCANTASRSVSSEKAFPQPVLISEWKSRIGETVTSIALHRGHIYASAGYDGAAVLKLSPSNTLEKITNFIENTRILTLHFFPTADSNTPLLAACGSDKDNTGSLMIFSLKKPGYPVPVFQTNRMTGSLPSAFANNGNTLYVADELLGLVVYEWTGKPAALAEKMRLRLDGARCRSISVDPSRQLAAIAAEEDGVFLVNLKTGKMITRIRHPLSIANSVIITNRLLVVGDRLSGVTFYDLGKPESPLNLGSYSTAGEAYDILLSGKQLTIADGGNGLIRIDINSIQSITNTWRFNAPGITFSAAIVSNTAYMACGADGIKMISIP